MAARSADGGPGCKGSKGCDHFDEWLSDMQGKLVPDLPTTLYDAVTAKLNSRVVSYFDVKRALKVLGLSAHYEHAPYIAAKLGGHRWPVLSPQLERDVRSTFRVVRTAFRDVHPHRSFPSYVFVTRKILEHLQQDATARAFPLYSNVHHLLDLEQLWTGVCEHLGWPTA
jgi:hypothetical protein